MATGTDFAAPPLVIERQAGASVGALRLAARGTLSTRSLAGADPFAGHLETAAYGCHVLLDLHRITGCETSGLVWLYDAGAQLVAAGGRLVVHSMPTPVHSLLSLVGTDWPFSIAGTESDALATLGS
jgi:hypothetical protein